VDSSKAEGTDFTEYRLRDVASIRHGFAFASQYFTSNEGDYLLTPGNFHEGGGFRPLGAKQKRYNGTVAPSFVLAAGDLLIAMTEQAAGLLGSALLVPSDGNQYLHNQRLGLVKATDPSIIEDKFLYYWFGLDETRRRISRDSSGTKVRHTSPDKVLALPILVPPLGTQRRIVEILTTWDRAIERNYEDIAAHRVRLRALRDNAFRERDWPMAPLRDIASRVRSVSDGRTHPVMTISAAAGFVLQSDRYNREMAGASLATYTLLSRGDFAYNKGNSLLYPQGCVFPLDEDSALVPSIYYSFRLRDELNPGFYEHFFAAGRMNRQLERIITSGVRGNGLLNITANDFFSCELPVPPKNVQDAISALLSDAVREIHLLEQKDRALREQRRSLLRGLLTGSLIPYGEE